MLKGRVFGGRCTESLASYDQESQCWRTSQISLPWGCPKYSDRFPKSGMMQNGQLYRLDNLERPTLEEDSSLLPTPTATDPDKHSTGGLIRRMTYPDGQKRYSKGDHRNLPTPTANLAKESGRPSDFKRNQPKLLTYFIEPGLPIGQRPRLRPQFVVWMMGFPIDWLS